MKSECGTRLGSSLPQVASRYWREPWGELPAPGKIWGILGNLLDWERILGVAWNSNLASPDALRLRALQGLQAANRYSGFAQKTGRGARSAGGQRSPCARKNSPRPFFWPVGLGWRLRGPRGLGNEDLRPPFPLLGTYRPLSKVNSCAFAG